MLEHTQAGDRWIPEAEYQLICDRVPILCVDLLPLLDHGRRFGLIRRDTYDGKSGLNLVGGAVLLDEPLTEAVQRHLRATLGDDAQIDVQSMHLVGIFQYFKKPRAGALHDPRKNAVSITYSAAISGETRPQGEAQEFRVFDCNEPPALSEFGFGQGSVVYAGLAQHRVR